MHVPHILVAVKLGVVVPSTATFWLWFWKRNGEDDALVFLDTITKHPETSGGLLTPEFYLSIFHPPLTRHDPTYW